MEKNFLREYKGYKLFEVGPFEGTVDINERRLDVEAPDGSPGWSNFFNSSNPKNLNIKIERAKEWIDEKLSHKELDRPLDVRRCRVCGCTDDNCQQCIDKTGSACHWVESDLCSACVPAAEVVQEEADEQNKKNEELNEEQKIQSSINETDMDFFTRLAAIPGVDLTLRIMGKNDKLTIEINPGSNKAAGIKPAVITGTGAEFDEEFFKTIFPEAREIQGIVSTLKDSKVQAQQKADKKRISDDKPRKPKPARRSAPPKKKSKLADKKGKEKPAKPAPAKKKEKAAKPVAKKAAVEQPEVVVPDLFAEEVVETATEETNS